jgi:hypothetical protein
VAPDSIRMKWPRGAQRTAGLFAARPMAKQLGLELKVQVAVSPRFTWEFVVETDCYGRVR